MIRSAFACLLSIGLSSAAIAQQDTAPLAQVGLQSRIETLSGQSETRGFELGMLLALRAVEKTMQTRYEFGLGDRIVDMPLLRLEFGPQNYAPKPATAEILTDMMTTLLGDLQSARAVLENAKVNDAVTPFELMLQDVWFDVDSNGVRDESEGAVAALGPILLGRRAMLGMGDALDEDIVVRFDEADQAWLVAYTHMLSGIGNLFVAFDPAPVIAKLTQERERLANAPTIPNTFDRDALMLEVAALNAEQNRVDRALKKQREKIENLRQEQRTLQDAKPRDAAAIAALKDEISTLQRSDLRVLRQEQRMLRTEIAAANSKLGNPRDGTRRSPDIGEQFMPQIDAIYVLISALRQQPDPARIKKVQDHWLAMMAQNKVFWSMLEAETDNDREWIPNPSQTAAFGIIVDQPTGEAWQALLEDAEALLQGRLLIPHPLLPAGTGISLKAYVENPGSLDLLEWIHGIGAYKYAAKGPLITQQRWAAFNRLTRGNAAGFALFFN